MIGTALSLFVSLAISAQPQSRYTHPIEPVDLPPSIQQGVDMMYIDPEFAPGVGARDASLAFGDGDGGTDLLLPANPIFTELRRGLVRYRMQWSGLPQVNIPSGPTLRAGSKGERVTLLRERLGLQPGEAFDDALARAVRSYQEVHGLKADGVAGEGTIASLNLGASHFERLLLINLDRARSLPNSNEQGRYIVVDAGEARVYLFEDGEIRQSMKAIVGKTQSATPMMAALMRYASVNPYWNVPVDLVTTLIAPKVLAEGISHLEKERYDVLSDWSDGAQVVDPATIDWAAVAAGTTELRVRQRPGAGNSMGAVKFMMPNEFGIYLHDTPDKSLFARDDRWISNGCVRVEDARKLAGWLFGEMPEGKDREVEENFDLDKPVPVYITYMTAGAPGGGVQFRKDPYGRDAPLLARYEVPETNS